MSPAEEHRFCLQMLPKVSRTFAACIRLLPQPVQHQVLVAYLLCRVADTAEDTAELPVATKEALLTSFRDRLADDRPADDWRATFTTPRIPDEELAREADAVLHEFRRLSPAAQDAIRPWVQEMCMGMASFAAKHARARPDHLEALESVEELDRYCYYVAGTVGHLLTDLFCLHSGRFTPDHRGRLKALSTSFGLGLQLTNIIKDVADDRRRGWSFVPRQLCRLANIDPENLCDSRHMAESHRVMEQLIRKARRHLHDALRYCCALPRSQYGIRLFCLTPLFFAVRTLAVAERDQRLLDPDHKVKITRGDVYRTLSMAHVVAPSNHLVRAYYRQLVGKRR